jgi:hypothetical protein
MASFYFDLVDRLFPYNATNAIAKVLYVGYGLVGR